MLTSGLFHVAYNYCSIALVLKSVSVVTHAVVNILKRLFVVLLLCLAKGNRQQRIDLRYISNNNFWV